MQLDHLVVAGETLAEAVEYIEATLGVVMQEGGKHQRYGTRNAVLGLSDGLYLEAIAIDPKARPQSLPRWFGLDAFSGPPRLITWAVRVPDLSAAIARYPVAGRCVDMRRGDLHWRMAVAEDGALPLAGVFPSLLQWQASPIPGESLATSGCTLKRLHIRGPNADADIPVPQAKVQIEVAASPEVSLEAVFQTSHGERILQ